MPYKNIILCSDGTGNKGGYTPDTNVFKIFKLVDIHNAEIKQVTFYDNGVGTSSFNPLRLLSGAIGTGFKNNVLDLYCYLAKAYNPGDKVFIFGFSRGAATARAFNGFLDHCGLIDVSKVKPSELNKKVDQLFDLYRKSKRSGTACPENKAQSKIDIQFIGVWDTVSALGAPQRTEPFGLVMHVVAAALKLLDFILDKLGPHTFYNYDLTSRVKNAYQALSVDDERTSFWPEIWNENDPAANDTNVEQVWFLGMHSDIGGGYKRGSLANIPLEWMMLRAKEHGLVFKPGAIQGVHHNINIEGLIHDSRAGLAEFYRYHPREIQSLCKDKMRNKIKIHETVVDRMAILPVAYGPTSLPDRFSVVSSIGNSSLEIEPIKNKNWSTTKNGITKNIIKRKKFYNRMLISVLALIAVSGYLWASSVEYWGRSGLSGHVADTFTYILPSYFKNIVEIGVSQYPIFGILLVLLIIGMVIYWRRLRRGTIELSGKLKGIVLGLVEEGRKNA